MRMISNKHFARNDHMANKKREIPNNEDNRKGLKIKQIDDYLRFALFLAVIGMFYIWNSHYAVKQVRKMEVLQKEAKNLKSKYFMKQSTLSAKMSLSEIDDLVDSIGLRRPKEPVYKLVRGEIKITTESPKRGIVIDSIATDSPAVKDSKKLPLVNIQ